MSLRSAVTFALIGMALWVIVLAFEFINSLIALARGVAAAASTLGLLIHLIAALSLLVFFAVYRRSRS